MAGVAIGMCTYRRPEQVVEAVRAALQQLDGLDAGDGARVIVVDNEASGSGRDALAAVDDTRLHVAVEPTPGISAARNRVLSEARTLGIGRLAFIDDDELPTQSWLTTLLATMDAHQAAAVAGPVVSLFTEDADPWVVAGGFFDRAHRAGLATGTSIPEAATNNLLLDLAVVERLGLRFSTDLGLTGGEDSRFTRELTSGGGTMVWCAEAGVTEVVPADRATRGWVLRRAMSFGNSRALQAMSQDASAGARVRLVAGGASRLVAGGGRAVAGVASRQVRHQGRGLRTAMTGAGMLLGASGFAYREYARDGRHVVRNR